MPNLNLRSITNHFQDMRLGSLAAWRQASEFSPRDHGGPDRVAQAGPDPEDLEVPANEFVPVRSATAPPKTNEMAAYHAGKNQAGGAKTRSR